MAYLIIIKAKKIQLVSGLLYGDQKVLMCELVAMPLLWGLYTLKFCEAQPRIIIKAISQKLTYRTMQCSDAG